MQEPSHTAESHRHPRPRRTLGLALLLVLVAPALSAQLAPPGQHAPAPKPGPGPEPAKASAVPDEIQTLPPVNVDTDAEDSTYDNTGMGAMDMEREDPPFSNDLLAAGTAPDDAAALLEGELLQIGGPPPGDLSAGQSRLDVRGFPSPRLRNGFTQLGVPDVLNPERNEQIAGAMVPVLGRAAPGGITNLVTARPKPRPGGTAGLSIGTLDSQRAFVDASRLLKAKRLWSRTSLSLSRRGGPEPFSFLRQRSLGQSFTWKPARHTALMLQLDWTDLRSRPSGGVPLYRLSAGSPILGYWAPLSEFHTNGPSSGQKKQLASAALQLESQPTRSLALRASVQWFSRRFTEDRFTRGEYLLDQRVFSGVREPQHSEQPLATLGGQVDATLRFRALGAEHKLLAAVEGGRAVLDRLQRGILAADRPLLLSPASMRFDPAAPDYSRPAYSTINYKRVVTDRSETTAQAAFCLSERAALGGGRLVATAGLRRDWLALRIEDRKPGARRPLVEDHAGRLTWHAGANYVALPGRLLLFANASTAFEPTLRVDARTGRIQGNESTSGWETGATAMAFARKLTVNFTAYRFLNRNIARRNPLYGDPVLDAEQTQPQLVAGGQERFSGATLELRWKPSPALTLSCRSSLTSAVTTASPDLPQEVGRQLSRLPRTGSSFSARLAPVTGPWSGASLGLGLAHIGPHTAWYEDASRARLKLPGYWLLNASAGWRLKQGKRSHAFSASVRNLLDTDLLARLARSGAARELSLSYTYGW